MNEELNNKEILHNLPFLTEIKEKDEKRKEVKSFLIYKSFYDLSKTAKKWQYFDFLNNK
jgi:hypothetical protein